MLPAPGDTPIISAMRCAKESDETRSLASESVRVGGLAVVRTRGRAGGGSSPGGVRCVVMWAGGRAGRWSV